MDPIKQFHEWYKEAVAKEIDMPDAMSLATVGADLKPSVRMVLLKGADQDGFVFYTNLTSRKAQEIDKNAYAALCFHWKSLKKQVRVEGKLKPVTKEAADKYFASRPRLSQIGAWASKQSQVMTTPFDLEKRVVKYTAKFNIGEIPRPEFWSGFTLVPTSIEFWEEKQFRLHERNVYKKVDGTSTWVKETLFP